MPVSRSPSRPPSGSPAYSPTDLPAYRGGSSFSPLDLSPVSWVRSPDAPSTTSCAITLTGDIAAVFGGQPLDISGQAVGKTVPASPANLYAAGGPGVAVSWSGWRGIGYQSSDFTTALDSLHGLVAISTDYTTYVQLLWADVTGAWIINVNGSVVGTLAGTALSKAGIRIDGSSGDTEVYVGGVSATKTEYPELGALFSGLTVIPAASLGSTGGPTLSEGDTYSAQIYTAAADLSDVGFPAGTLDWCGNAIGVDGLYQDSAGTTPVTAAGQDVGKRNDQSGNARNMTQATATARPTYETGPARLEYDVDDALSCTLPAISGGQIVIISPAGTWIDSLDFAGGTFTIGPDTYTGGPAGLMTLLGNEEMEIVILPTAMTEAEQAKMVAYAKSIGSAGLITHPTEKLGGGDFEAGLIGAKSDGSGSVSTWSINTTAPISGTQDGRLVITTPASLRPLINFSSGIMSGFETGKSYVLEFDYKLNSGSFLFRYTVGGPVASVFGTVSAASGKVRLIHEATATNTQMFFYFDSSTCDVQMDNISVREVIMP